MSNYGQVQFKLRDGMLGLDHVSLHDEPEEHMQVKVDICKQYKCFSFEQGGVQLNLFFPDEETLKRCVDELYEKVHHNDKVEAV